MNDDKYRCLCCYGSGEITYFTIPNDYQGVGIVTQMESVTIQCEVCNGTGVMSESVYQELSELRRVLSESD